jgi:hypothetical protein
MRAKIALLGAAAGLFLSLGAGTAQADRRDDCWKKINKAENNLRNAIRNHGPYSRKAQNRREELRRVQSRCGGFGWGNNRGRDDNWWGRDRRDRDRDDWRWRDRDRDRDGRWNRGRRDNTWNRGRGNRARPISWFWSRDGRRHRHSSNGAWCNVRH